MTLFIWEFQFRRGCDIRAWIGAGLTPTTAVRQCSHSGYTPVLLGRAAAARASNSSRVMSVRLVNTRALLALSKWSVATLRGCRSEVSGQRGRISTHSDPSSCRPAATAGVSAVPSLVVLPGAASSWGLDEPSQPAGALTGGSGRGPGGGSTSPSLILQQIAG